MNKSLGIHLAKIKAPMSPAFKAWFGGSKAVDSNGDPLVLFHGTKSPPGKFAPSREGISSTLFGSWATERHGIFLAEDPNLAEEFATQGENPTGATIMPLYLRATNPIDLSESISNDQFDGLSDLATQEGLDGYSFAKIVSGLSGYEDAWVLFDLEQGWEPALFIKILKRMGYDSALLNETSDVGASGKTWVAFDPSQVKSAIGNVGTYDPENEEIVASKNKQIGIHIADFQPPVSIDQALYDLMAHLPEGFPFPKIRIVSDVSARWLGKDVYTVGDKTTTILLQKYVLGDDATLRKILAHELCHHADFLLSWEKKRSEGMNVKTYQFLKNIGTGHGEGFQEWAQVFNRVYGADYVTINSDKSMVLQEHTRDIQVLLWNTRGRISWAYSVQPSSKQKLYIEKALQGGAVLTTTRDVLLAQGASIGKGRASTTDESLNKELQQLWDAAAGDTAPQMEMQADYSYSSTQINLPKELASKIKTWMRETIAKEDLYDDPEDPTSSGFEDHLHCTLLYGLTGKDQKVQEQLRELVEGYGPIRASLGKVSIFDGAKKDKPYDVVKLTVESEDLRKLHTKIKKGLPNKETWPSYQPHVTLAYVVTGTGKKYVGLDKFEGEKFELEHFVFAPKEDKKRDVVIRTASQVDYDGAVYEAQEFVSKVARGLGVPVPGVMAGFFKMNRLLGPTVRGMWDSDTKTIILARDWNFSNQEDLRRSSRHEIAEWLEWLTTGKRIYRFTVGHGVGDFQRLLAVVRRYFPSKPDSIVAYMQKAYGPNVFTDKRLEAMCRALGYSDNGPETKQEYLNDLIEDSEKFWQRHYLSGGYPAKFVVLPDGKKIIVDTHPEIIEHLDQYDGDLSFDPHRDLLNIRMGQSDEDGEGEGAGAYWDGALTSKQVNVLKDWCEWAMVVLPNSPVSLGRHIFDSPGTALDYIQDGRLRVASNKYAGTHVGRHYAKIQAPQTPAFKAWFSGSKVVDAQGNPLMVYHGTNAENFEAFDIERGGYQTAAESAEQGIFFTDNPDVADEYSKNIGMGGMFALWLNPDSPVSKLREAILRDDPKARALKEKMDQAKVHAEAEAKKWKQDALFTMNERLKDTPEVLETMVKGMSPQQRADWLDEMSSILATPEVKKVRQGIYDKFHDAEDELSAYLVDQLGDQLPNRRIIPTYLRIVNPAVYDAEGQSPADFPLSSKIAEAKQSGHDGVIFKNLVDPTLPCTHYVIFDPKQAKSAIGSGYSTEKESLVARVGSFEAEEFPPIFDNVSPTRRRQAERLHRLINRMRKEAYEKQTRLEAGGLPPEEEQVLRGDIEQLLVAINGTRQQMYGLQTRPGRGPKEWQGKPMDPHTAKIEAPQTPEFQSWFGKSKVVNEDGSPKVVFHGTTHVFSEFSVRNTSPDSFLGRGLYFTDSPKDLENYTGQGPDLTYRLDQEAEKIMRQRGWEDRDYSPEEYDEAYLKALDLAKKKLVGPAPSGVAMPVYLKIEKPLYLTEGSLFPLEIEYEEDENGDIVSETGGGIKFLQHLQKLCQKYGIRAQDLDALVYKVYEALQNGVSTLEMDKLLRSDEGIAYLEDKYGNLVSTTVLKNLYQKSGFDGIIMDAELHFSLKGKGMPGVEGALHYIVFDPRQVKSALGNVGTYDPKSKNIGAHFTPRAAKGEDPPRPSTNGKAPGVRLTPTEFINKLAQEDQDKYGDGYPPKFTVIPSGKIWEATPTHAEAFTSTQELCVKVTGAELGFEFVDCLNVRWGSGARPPSGDWAAYKNRGMTSSQRRILIDFLEWLILTQEKHSFTIATDYVSTGRQGYEHNFNTVEEALEWLRGGGKQGSKHTAATKEDFWELAELQRGAPEAAMVQAQYALGGGVLSLAIEHVGDINHRMNQQQMFQFAGYDYVKNKVEKSLRWLTYPYGFRREHEENMVSNAEHYGKSLEAYRDRAQKALREYVKAHEVLPVYNKAQELAQSAAVSLGEERFEDAILFLRALQAHLGSEQEWVAFAHEGLAPGNKDVERRRVSSERVTLYHGTTGDALKGIRTVGLRASGKDEDGFGGGAISSKTGVYVTEDETLAWEVATSLAERKGSTPVIILIQGILSGDFIPDEDSGFAVGERMSPEQWWRTYYPSLSEDKRTALTPKLTKWLGAVHKEGMGSSRERTLRDGFLPHLGGIRPEHLGLMGWRIPHDVTFSGNPYIVGATIWSSDPDAWSLDQGKYVDLKSRRGALGSGTFAHEGLDHEPENKHVGVHL